VAKTVLDMHYISSALKVYYSDHGHYPLNLEVLDPQYIRSVPNHDQWGMGFWYVTSNSQQSYSLGRGGRDKSTPNWELKPGITKGFDADIIIFNGQWIRFPEKFKE